MWNTTSANPPLQACKTWAEARNICCFCSQKSQMTCTCPSFQYFSLSWNRTQVAQNSCVPTKNGRKCAAWWAIWWQISGAGKGKLSWLVEALCRDFRQHEEEEPTKLGARALYLNMPKVEMTDRVCDGYRKTAKWLTSREVRLIVDYLGEPWGSSGCRTACEIVLNRTVIYESYDCHVRLSYLCRVIGKRAENHFSSREKRFF